MALTTENGLDGDYVASPLERIRKQVADYEASGGVEGGTLEGRPVVILTSVGTKSGKVRKNPVMRIVDGDRYVAVASAGGSPTNPSWYANLVAHPRVRLQDGANVREFAAREVTGDEKRYYWAVAERFWPHFPDYRRMAGARDIPIMVLEPVAPRTQSRRLSGTAPPLSLPRRHGHEDSSRRRAQQSVRSGGVRHVVQSA
jgi:deazaflavin-dependent oxidoreductase (nitroreductase family)